MWISKNKSVVSSMPIFFYFSTWCDRHKACQWKNYKNFNLDTRPFTIIIYISFKQMVASCKNDWTKEDCLRCKGAIFGLNRSNSSSKQYITFFLKVIMRNKNLFIKQKQFLIGHMRKLLENSQFWLSFPMLQGLTGRQCRTVG